MLRTPLLAALLLAGCKSCNDEGPVPAPDESVILGVPQTASQSLPGLEGTVEVLFNAQGVPSVFGEDEADVALVHGYLIARDRYFILDLSRRLGLGEIAALVGQDGLESDLESRQRGLTHVAELMLAELERAPTQAAYIDGYAAGINAYIEQVQAGVLPPPPELALLAPLLGVEPLDVMEPFDRRDIAAGMAFIVFETAWEPGDVNRAADAARLPGLFDDAPLGELRQAGVGPDVFDRVIPAVSVGSAVDWTPGAPSPWGPPPAAPPPAAASGGRAGPTPAPGMLERLQERLHSAATRMGKDREAGFGSNAWAVAGAHTASGNAVLAADPHLPLSIPSVMWQVGLDTRELGGGDLHVVGHQLAAFPYMASGTNGDIAWGQTNTGGGDITDWYAEQITLDDQGAPAFSLFDGVQEPLVVTEDTYEIATVAALGSVGGTQTIARYATFDGRWITSIEGRPVDGPDDAGPGETAVNLMGDWVIPEDVDGVGGITAVSFDYTGFDMHAMMRAADGIVKAEDLDGFVEVTRDFVAYGLQIVAADSSGSILYTPFMAMPCRGYLERTPDGGFAKGADPRELLDGTRYGGFEIPADADGHVDYGQAADPYRCVVPWEDHPWSHDPAQGFLATANADPADLSFDDSLSNDAAYIGGPWTDGFRMAEISEELGMYVERGRVTPEDMRVLQSNHTSGIGMWLAPVLVDAIDAASQASPDAADPSEARLADLYAAHADRFEEVADRLTAWGDRGYAAESGVETFYAPAPDEGMRADAVATMIFNAWMGRYVSKAIDDEGMPKGDTGTFGVLRMMLESRGDPAAAASYNPEMDESAYWDILSTPEIESSDEVALLSLVEAVAFLEGPYEGDGQGGFDTPDADAWLWGLRHWVVMEPLLLDLLGDDFGFLLGDFTIDTSTLPLAEGLTASDPRWDLPGFPRHSDHKNVDAANSGTNGVEFDNAYGPTARMVVELTPDGATGINIVPGGQSVDPQSPHFADQARLWLANEAVPISTNPAEIVVHAVGRETFTP